MSSGPKTLEHLHLALANIRFDVFYDFVELGNQLGHDAAPLKVVVHIVA